MGQRRTITAVTALRYLELALSILISVCLAVLAVRAAVRLEDRWDTFMYHLPFAAIRGGLDIPYEMSDKMVLLFQSFPPLANFAQGLLWRVTGSVNATGVVNYLAFFSFLAVCQRKLGAPFYLVAAIALTAPLVLIHASVSYVDLFGNSWLALGIVCLFFAYYFDKTDDRGVLAAGLLGLAAAAWTKFQLVPLVALFIPMYLVVYRPVNFRFDSGQRKSLFWILAITLLAAAPYLSNWARFGNPFWPVDVPWFGEILGLTQNGAYMISTNQVPPPYINHSQFELFIRSLFEIGHPHEYPHRQRWIIDQGNAWVAFRSGGFWNVSVVAYLLMAAILLLTVKPKKGIMVIVAGIATLLLVSVLLQSHELRYYLFIPLVWAGIIGILYTETRRHHVLLSIGVLITALSLFTYVSRINLSYYQIERIGFTEIATKWGANRWWPQLRTGIRYCAVDVVPMGMMMTGPTMREFYIIERSREDLCPQDTVHIGNTAGGTSLADMMNQALDLIYRKGNYAEALRILSRILEILPTHFGAMWQRAEALERFGEPDNAVEAWGVVIEEATAKGYGDLASAKARLAALQNRK